MAQPEASGRERHWPVNMMDRSKNERAARALNSQRQQSKDDYNSWQAEKHHRQEKGEPEQGSVGSVGAGWDSGPELHSPSRAPRSRGLAEVLG